MTDLFSYGPRNLKDFIRKNLLAILYTVIIHLLVAIVLIIAKVDSLKEDHELGVTLDYTEEQTQDELQDEEMVEIPAEWMEQIYEAREQASNRAVNLNDETNKEISTDDYVKDLLDELEAQKDEEFLADREKWEEIISSYVYDDQPVPSQEEEEEDEPFTGPTRISYEFLEAPLNRNSRKLSIPVYRCEGSALVIVDIVVSQDGSVSEAKVSSTQTDRDPQCFIDAAENAALSSKFRSDFGAPGKHRARLSYQFVAQ